MGLHPSDGNVYADGWYSGRIAAFYENNDYDTKKEAEVSKAEIKGYIDTYKNDHKAFTSFLSKKVASQWNNPEFQCFWITNVRSSDIEKSPVISDILSLKGSSTFIAFLNIMQSIILLGSMLYAVNTLIEGTFAGAAVLPLTYSTCSGKANASTRFLISCCYCLLVLLVFTAWQRNCPMSQRSIYTNVVYSL